PPVPGPSGPRGPAGSPRGCPRGPRARADGRGDAALVHGGTLPRTHRCGDRALLDPAGRAEPVLLFGDRGCRARRTTVDRQDERDGDGSEEREQSRDRRSSALGPGPGVKPWTALPAT